MDKGEQRLRVLRDQLGNVETVEPKVIDKGDADATMPKYEYFKLNGWGFKDTRIVFNRQTGYGFITGSRYTFSGAVLKELKKFAEKEVDFKISGEPIPCQDQMKVDPPYINEPFLAEIAESYSRLSFEDRERTMHSHGHTLHVV